MNFKTTAALVSVMAASFLAGCSASGSDAGLRSGDVTGAGGGGGGGGSVPGGGTAGTSTGFGGDTIIGVGATAGAAGGGDLGQGGDGSCGITQKPEEILVYSPVGLFIMQDRSSSMVTGFPPPASPDGWNNSTAAVTAFVNDAASAGISVGLGTFPALSGTADCGGADCGTPVVPIAALPGNAPAMISGMQSAVPTGLLFTPTECGLRGMVAECVRYKARAQMQCVGVLVTDGTPTLCNGDPAALAKILSDAVGQNMKTFVIGLPGSNLPALDQLAAAGGTTKAIDVSGGPSAFIAALNSIRSQVSVGTALPCQWKIPPPKDGQIFNPDKVNVKFTPKGGAARDFGYVAQADCARATDAWYFDNPAAATQVFACPTTCDMLKASSGAEIDVSFGCARKPAILK